MSGLLITLLAITFIGLLFLNFFFRAKVLKSYKHLVQNRVEFPAKYIFNKTKLTEEIIPKYPKQKQHILDFVNNIHRSIRMASAFLVVIILLGLILMRI